MQRIKRMKDRLIKEAQSRLRNMDGGSIEQMGQIIDMIKDLSEAEKSCLEAEYYDIVIDAMENGQRYGYDDESIDNIRQMMEDADPERKRQLKRDLEDLMSEM